MYENRNVCPLRPPLGCFEVHSDQGRQVYMSRLPAEAREEKEPSKAEKIVNILSGIISIGSCTAMMWLAARMAGII